ncbi:MAG: hypothetical protein Q4F83_16025 [Eubacteriales bacterium]|nr:hypothetical protein [Eubacteriales bacterium]
MAISALFDISIDELLEIQFDGAGSAELVTWDKNIEAWIAQIRKEIEMKPEEF